MSLIIVDLETTGLKRNSKIVEVAAVPFDNPDTPLHFIPQVTRFDVKACGDGLQINRYFERGLHQYMDNWSDTIIHYRELNTLLRGNTLAGSNPRFDANRLARMFRLLGMTPEPWHYRLSDVSAYGAGVLGIKPTEAPGLHGLCEMLGVVNEEEHGAMGDAMATVECYRKLIELQNVNSERPKLQW